MRQKQFCPSASLKLEGAPKISIDEKFIPAGQLDQALPNDDELLDDSDEDPALCKIIPINVVALVIINTTSSAGIASP